MAHRSIVFDTETTGLDPDTGDRLIEIGCVELIDRKPTGRTFHAYMDPEREVPEAAVKVHGLQREDLRELSRQVDENGNPFGPPRVFADFADELLAFIDGAELIAHNAVFDMRFLDAELKRIGREPLTGNVKVTDTLRIARDQVWPGMPNSLDALADRYGIDRTQRDKEGHGALLDAKLLSEIYLCLTRQQASMVLDADSKERQSQTHHVALKPKPVSPELAARVPALELSDEELQAHQALIRDIGEESGSEPSFPF